MELLLWRWSTAVQVTSITMVAVFFAVLARWVRRVELRWWMQAWLANLSALGITLFFWYSQPGPAIVPLLWALYLATKTAFVLLLIEGAWALRRPGTRLLRGRYAIPAVAIYSIAGAMLLTSRNGLGTSQSMVMALLFGASGIALATGAAGGMAWLAGGFLVRSLLCVVEAAAYAVHMVPAASLPSGLVARAGTFLSASSSLDTGAEWLIALGCVLAISERTHRELRRFNDELLTAQDDLRRLADRDPLTSLDNRRTLSAVFRAVQPSGATLLFFDLDGFKQINDLHGHRTGDECLKRVATTLRECFRPGDAVVRYAGDEFLVVARALDRLASAERVERVRERLQRATAGSPAIGFTVGVSELPAGGQPNAALQAADEAMYQAKMARVD